LTVGGDKDSNRTIDTVGHDAVVEWQGDGDRFTAEHHLAEEFLELAVDILGCIVDIGLKRIYRSIVRARDCTGGEGQLSSWTDNPSVSQGQGLVG